MTEITERIFGLVALVKNRDWRTLKSYLQAMPEDELIIGYTTLYSLRQSPAYAIYAERAQKFVAGELSKRNSDDHQ